MEVTRFIHDLSWSDIPGNARVFARRCLMDTLGAGIGGRRTDLSRIVHEVATEVYGGWGGVLWQDGREVSPAGAALANGMTVDALDIHDGYRPSKGHAGAAVVPALLATLSLDPRGPIAGQELLATLVVGYEVALRAAVSLHATAGDYHTSGAWNALGCAAVTARRLGLSAGQTRHALGIAEYHGPRSPMMRCIDHPAMLKDGSGWGSMTGVTSALLARRDFTGAPALTVEAPGVAPHWADLGSRWLIAEQYFKPHAVCYWAQPAIAGALALQQSGRIPVQAIKRVRVFTFHEATRLDCPRPQTTEEAQYSLPFPIAAALVHARLGPAELSGDALHDPAVLGLAGRVELMEDPALSARFPGERLARVEIETADGAVLDSGEVRPRWDTSAPATDSELREKFRWLAGTVLPPARVRALEETLWRTAELPDASALILLLAPPD